MSDYGVMVIVLIYAVALFLLPIIIPTRIKRICDICGLLKEGKQWGGGKASCDWVCEQCREQEEAYERLR